MKLALVISSLGGGGAERVMATLADAWAAQGVKVTLITLAPTSHDRYEVSPAVSRVVLDKSGASPSVLRAIVNNLTRVRALRAAILACQPDVVISFVAITNMLTLMAAIGLRLPVIVAEHTFIGAKTPRGIWSKFHGPLYRRAAAVVALTRRSASLVEKRLGCTVTVIPNPVPFPAAGANAAVTASHKTNSHAGKSSRTLLAVGRLMPVKGFDLLIEAFATAVEIHPDWNLRILGEGCFRETLAEAVAARGLCGRVSMPGFTSNVRTEMQQADLFVLSSRFEGFPMALLEAMSEGCACVSFDCETGPRELIKHAENGWLVPAGDVAALTKALVTLMGDAALRQRLGEHAREVIRTYSLPAVLDQWNALINTVVFPHAPSSHERHLRNAIR